uniref:Uncharacterized protein n=1 Tax=Caenorhabditis japonica TaxID=281687 RepID=A0A8R1IMX1_CAEJA
TWDDALRTEANKLCDSCGKREYNDAFRHYYIFYNESVNAVKSYTAGLDELLKTGQIEKMVDFSNKHSTPEVFKLERYVPTQNKIGCHSCRNCPFKLGSVDVEKYEWCLIGPK